MSNNDDFYSISSQAALKRLESRKEGLKNREVRARLEQFGPNELRQKKKIHPIEIFISQFTSIMVIILIAAAGISFLIGELLDASAIMLIVMLNAVFGFVQEYRAKKAIEALRRLSGLKATVLRDSKIDDIDAKELVPGDIIILETGDKVPADARIISSSAFSIDEALLTGESVPSAKEDRIYPKDTPLADRENMAYKGSVVTAGHAKAVICATGMDTQMGKIADMIQDDEQLTPLQKDLKNFAFIMGVVAIVFCVLVFSTGVLKHYMHTGVWDDAVIIEMFLASVALIVSVLPEGLPAVVTISLALGVGRMVKKNALIRKLPSVETLGATNVICSDKTGTLTKNQMTVQRVYVDGEMINVDGRGYEPKGDFKNSDGKRVRIKDLELLLRIGAVCNDSRLQKDDGRWEVNGDPTEGALKVSAAKYSLTLESLEGLMRVGEIPFDSKRKLMSTIHNVDKKDVMYTKGAADVILSRCSHILIDGKKRRMTKKIKDGILKVNDEMAEDALRVLGFAYKELPKKYAVAKRLEQELIFVGLQGMIDPPREEVREAIQKCKRAQIKTLVITGDHKTTAMAIAKRLGMLKTGDVVIEGKDLENISDDELDSRVHKIAIVARASPEHKVRILESLKREGNVVAMTGDGVNDAPALTKADIGISMGLGGTDVAKESSDMVLTDDNFASIVAAVEEGRKIYHNIKDFIRYTLASNMGELVAIFVALVIGWPLPLLALQILWVNLLTDGLPGLALGLDPIKKDLMRMPPRRKDEKILDSGMAADVVLMGAITGAGALFVFNHYGAQGELARTAAFTALICFQLFYALSYRAKSIFTSPMDAKYLLGAVGISFALHIVILYTPVSAIFETVPLGIGDWMLILPLTITTFVVAVIKEKFDYMSPRISHV